MTISYVNSPSKQEFSHINELISCCAQFEPVTFTECRDECACVLLYDNQILVSFISLFFPEQNICECTGFTHPAHRRKGYFSKCLEKVCAILEEQETHTGSGAELVLLSDGNSQDALKTMKALEAEFWYAEHMMGISVKKLTGIDGQSQRNVHIKELGEGQFQILAQHSLCGSFCLYETKKYACLYDLFLEPDKRGLGYALSSLCQIGRYLEEKNIPVLKLQVSGLNIPAVSLYKKAGFQMLETLSYYLY